MCALQGLIRSCIDSKETAGLFRYSTDQLESGRQCRHNLEIRSFRADGQNCRVPRPQMEFSGTFPSALLQVDRLPSRTPTPELLQKYRCLSCTFVILTTRDTGLRLSRAYCARARLTTRWSVP